MITIDKKKKIKRNTILKERIIAHKRNINNFIIGTFFAAFLSFLLTFTGMWQLIIVSGIVAGCFNDKMKRGIFAGAIGVTFVWLAFIFAAIISINAYINVDQFAGLIFGNLGFGWVIIIFILLFGVLFGALGGAFGSGIKMLVKISRQSSS